MNILINMFGYNLAFIIWNVLKTLILFVPLILTVAYLTLAERRVLGFMHARIGANRVGPKGLLQPFADLLKFVLKEIVVPEKASSVIFYLAPVILLTCAFTSWAVIPFSPEMYFANVNAGVLFVVAISSLGVYGIVLAGWAGNSKYGFLGGVRSAAMLISYELAMGFALLGVLMVSSSLNFIDIVNAQAVGRMHGSIFSWNFIPLFPFFIIYIIAGIAETNRAPFDVCEGESEIVAGFHVEYSGTLFALFMLSEYANMILLSTLTSIMFLGGWLSPFPNTWGILGVASIFWLILKVFLLLFGYIWYRATFPRYRYDQIMRLGWKVFLPVTLVWIFILGAWMISPLSIW